MEKEGEKLGERSFPLTLSVYREILQRCTVGKTGCASNRAHACMLAYTRAEIHFHLSYTPHTPGQTAKQLVATPVDPGQLLRNPWLNFSRRILGEKSRLLLACRRIPRSCIPSGYTILFILDFISPIFVYSFINSFFSPRPAIVYFVSRIGII